MAERNDRGCPAHSQDDLPDAIRVAGRIDVRNVADLRRELHGVVDAGCGDVRIDVSGLELVDAAGLGALLGAHRRARRVGRGLVLVDVPDRLARQLFVTRLSRILRIERVSDADAGGAVGSARH